MPCVAGQTPTILRVAELRSTMPCLAELRSTIRSLVLCEGALSGVAALVQLNLKGVCVAKACGLATLTLVFYLSIDVAASVEGVDAGMEV
jgi:hypothetical protein